MKATDNLLCPKADRNWEQKMLAKIRALGENTPESPVKIIKIKVKRMKNEANS